MAGGFQTPTHGVRIPGTYPWREVSRNLPMAGGFQTPTHGWRFPDTYPWLEVSRHLPMAGGFQTPTHGWRFHCSFRFKCLGFPSQVSVVVTIWLEKC
jgi:hypothetical protein